MLEANYDPTMILTISMPFEVFVVKQRLSFLYKNIGAVWPIQ